MQKKWLQREVKNDKETVVAACWQNELALKHASDTWSKVKILSNVPSGLGGVKIPSNEYLVYPMTGDKSDYEGEGWDQLHELMQYRNAESADFEVYTFDDSYEITQAEMWIATK